MARSFDGVNDILLATGLSGGDLTGTDDWVLTGWSKFLADVATGGYAFYVRDTGAGDLCLMIELAASNDTIRPYQRRQTGGVSSVYNSFWDGGWIFWAAWMDWSAKTMTVYQGDLSTSPTEVTPDSTQNTGSTRRVGIDEINFGGNGSAMAEVREEADWVLREYTSPSQETVEAWILDRYNNAGQVVGDTSAIVFQYLLDSGIDTGTTDIEPDESDNSFDLSTTSDATRPAPSESPTFGTTVEPSVVALTTTIPAPAPAVEPVATAVATTIAIPTPVPAVEPVATAVATTIAVPSISVITDIAVTIATTIAIGSPTVEVAIGSSVVALTITTPTPGISKIAELSAVALTIAVPAPTTAIGIPATAVAVVVAIPTPMPLSVIGASVVELSVLVFTAAGGVLTSDVLSITLNVDRTREFTLER